MRPVIPQNAAAGVQGSRFESVVRLHEKRLCHFVLRHEAAGAFLHKTTPHKERLTALHDIALIQQMLSVFVVAAVLIIAVLLLLVLLLLTVLVLLVVPVLILLIVLVLVVLVRHHSLRFSAHGSTS